MRPLGEILSVWGAAGAADNLQGFAWEYTVTIRTTDNSTTRNCHLLQLADSQWDYFFAADAVKPTARTFQLDVAHAAGFVSSAVNKTVNVSNTTDYIASDTKIRKIGAVDYAYIWDRPTANRLPGGAGPYTYYKFIATNVVAEAPQVSGWARMDATFTFNAGAKGVIDYSISSSDGNLNKSGKA